MGDDDTPRAGPNQTVLIPFSNVTVAAENEFHISTNIMHVFPH